ncbi:MAG TPA: GNAT family N-acetyltransferase [Chitinophagaceae bacterium]|nr:GNAT family N-acetyltransferase [Chitinophagaceae bacterium]
MVKVIRILPASVTDMPLVRGLAEKIWPAAYSSILSPEQIRYMMDLLYSNSSLERQISQDGHRFLLAFREEEPLGFASFGSLGGEGFKLHKLYVLPSSQGSGIGKMLMDQVIGEAKTSLVTFLELNVNRFNPARKFYERLGFRVLREVDIPIGGGFFMNDYIMRLPLSPGN